MAVPGLPVSWWVVGYDHEACNATGVPNGVIYHDGTHMAPLPDASGHYYRHGGYCDVHKSCAAGWHKQLRAPGKSFFYQKFKNSDFW